MLKVSQQNKKFFLTWNFSSWPRLLSKSLRNPINHWPTEPSVSSIFEHSQLPQQFKLKKHNRRAFKPDFDLDVNAHLQAMSCRGNKCVRKEKYMKLKLNLGRKCHKNITFIKRFSNHLDRIVVCLFPRSTSEIEVPLIIKWVFSRTHKTSPWKFSNVLN